MDPKVFSKAASTIFYKAESGSNIGACLAIALNTEFADQRTGAQNFIFDLLAPKYALEEDFWYGPKTKTNQLARQLGLLLCAEVLKDEQKAKRKKK